MLPKLKGDTFFMPLPGGGSLVTYADQQKRRGRNFNSRKSDPRTLKRVMQAFYPYRSEVVTIITGILVVTLLGLVPPLLISYAFDDAIQKGDTTLLLIYVGFIVAALILASIIGVGQVYLSNKVGRDVMDDLHNQLYRHLQIMPQSFSTETRTGEMRSHLATFIGEVQGAVTNTVSNLVSDLIIIVSTLILMIVISPLLTLIALALLPLFAWITYQAGKAWRKMSEETQRSTAFPAAQTEATSPIIRIVPVKGLGQQKHAQAQFQHENKTQTDLTRRQRLIGHWLIALITTFLSLVPLLLYLVAGKQIIQHTSVLGSTMTIGIIVAFTILEFRLVFPVGELMGLRAEFQGAMALFDHIFEYLDLPIDMQDKPDALRLTPEVVQGKVTFRNVTFPYKRGEYSVLTDTSSEGMPDNGEVKLPTPTNPDALPDLQEEPRPAMKNISFTINPGQLVALAGPGDEDKATITYLLLRLYDVDSGAVEIDGINVKDIAQASLGKLIGVVTQETHLFHASIRENLLYARRDATEEEMIAAAQEAAIHERIMELEKDYDTIVGERGYKLSDDEKHRIAIARAILKNPRILIVDEPASALDSYSEHLMQTALETSMQDRTTLTIAHRLSTMLAANMVLVVNQGEIVERGTHEELLALGGLYAQLYQEQFSQPSLGIGQVQDTGSVQSTGALPRTVSAPSTESEPRTGSAQGTTPTVPHTMPAIETQISHLQPSEVTMQKKTTSPKGKLPLRVASKEDLLSTTYLPPSVRVIFLSTPQEEQEEQTEDLLSTSHLLPSVRDIFPPSRKDP